MFPYPTYSIGLYLHVPFCSQICSYCDFKKTALWDKDYVQRYLKRIESDFCSWRDHVLIPQGVCFDTFHMGGGTPGIFAEEYRDLFQLIQPFLSDHAEIALEANPNDVTLEKLGIWKELGVTRLSLGAQTLNSRHLKTLNRDHNGEKVLEALALAQTKIPNVNVDLIYGIPTQTRNEWQSDLSALTESRATHLSFYHLTYAQGTPLGRSVLRGKTKELPEDDSVLFYEDLREALSSNGWFHYEVSNAAKPGFLSTHNQKYWSQGYYLGLGLGSFGFIPLKEDPLGVRYQYISRRLGFDQVSLRGQHPLEDPRLIKEERDRKSWLYEAVGSGIRYFGGVDLKKLEDNFQIFWEPKTPLLEEGVKQNSLVWEQKKLSLSPTEWFREGSWCSEILDGFTIS